jgi:hypothetical protein
MTWADTFLRTLKENDVRLDAGGPALLAAKIDDAPGTAQTVRDPPLIRHRFMRGLGTARTSALDA